MSGLKKIVIRIGDVALEAELNQSQTSQMIWNALPLEGRGQNWGDEIYFRIPVDAPPENAVATVSKGDIAYWPPGNAFCIFYGPTPASEGDEIVPASPVNIIGQVTSDVEVLKDLKMPETVRVEKGM